MEGECNTLNIELIIADCEFDGNICAPLESRTHYRLIKPQNISHYNSVIYVGMYC